MLDSILEQLLSTIGAPLFTAVSIRKKKSSKRSAKKQAQPKHAGKKTARAKKVAKKISHKPTRPAAVAPSKKTPLAKKGVAQGIAKAPAVPAPAKSEEYALVVKPSPPTGRAILLTPENDKFTDNVHPTFRWLSVGGATRYEIAWSAEPNLAQVHPVVSIATEAAVPVEKPLTVGMSYFWRVRGGNESGWGPWSSISTFRVLDEAV